MVFHDKILLRGVIKGGLIFSVGDYALFRLLLLNVCVQTILMSLISGNVELNVFVRRCFLYAF